MKSASMTRRINMKEGRVNTMKQLELDLDWLNEDWTPTKVTRHTNRGEMSGKDFDDWYAQQAGHNDWNTIILTDKEGKTTLLGSPYIHEGL
jgi:hypothetical protein